MQSPFMMWAIMDHRKYLSFLSLPKICLFKIPPTLTKHCKPKFCQQLTSLANLSCITKTMTFLCRSGYFVREEMQMSKYKDNRNNSLFFSTSDSKLISSSITEDIRNYFGCIGSLPVVCRITVLPHKMLLVWFP